jgi:hypothetical protein
MKGKGFESVRRMMRSVEKSWYSRGERSRFRHIMPLDFTVRYVDIIRLFVFVRRCAEIILFCRGLPWIAVYLS